MSTDLNDSLPEKLEIFSADLNDKQKIDLSHKLDKALVLFRENNLDEAKAFFLMIIDQDPSNFFANKFLGLISFKQGNWGEAVKYSLSNYQYHSNKIESFTNLAVILMKNPKHDVKALSSAVDVLKDALKLDDKAIEVYVKLYNAYEALGNLSEAKKYLDKAKEINPKNLKVLVEESNYLRDTGELEASMEVSREILKMQADHIDSIYNLFFLKKFQYLDEELKLAEALYGTTKSDHEEKCLNFALFKAYDDLKDYQKAYGFLKRGNEVAKAMSVVDAKHDIKILSYLRKVFTKDYIEKKIKELNFISDINIKPIFIVSMPRSGSTLLEKILSSHSNVSSAGEPLYFKQSAGELEFNFSLDDPLVSTTENLKSIAENYLALLSSHAKQEDIYVIDKLPINFAFLGLIKIFYPDAKIIYLDRDPCAVGFSCYKHMFSHGQDFSFDTEDIVEYYKAYKFMKEHWRANLPEHSFLEISYEELIENPRENIENVLNYCGLEWQDACERFYESQAIVQSASLAQVRKPLYKGSNEAWKNYQDFMPGFFDKLKNL